MSAGEKIVFWVVGVVAVAAVVLAAFWFEKTYHRTLAAGMALVSLIFALWVPVACAWGYRKLVNRHNRKKTKEKQNVQQNQKNVRKRVY